MALTRSFKDLVQRHVAADPAYGEALLREGIDTMLAGDVETGMRAAEIRDGDFGFMIDYLHTPLLAGITTKNIVFSGGTGGLGLDGGLAMFYYRPFKQPDQYLEHCRIEWNR